jgi:hypothetical protein
MGSFAVYFVFLQNYGHRQSWHAPIPGQKGGRKRREIGHYVGS